MAATSETAEITQMSTAERFDQYNACVKSRVQENSHAKSMIKGENVHNKSVGSEAEAKLHCQGKYMSQLKEKGSLNGNTIEEQQGSGQLRLDQKK